MKAILLRHQTRFESKFCFGVIIFGLRGLQWILTYFIRRMRLPNGLICIHFTKLTNSNQLWLEFVNFVKCRTKKRITWIILVLFLHIKLCGSRIFRMEFLKIHCKPRIISSMEHNSCVASWSFWKQVLNKKITQLLKNMQLLVYTK